MLQLISSFFLSSFNDALQLGDGKLHTFQDGMYVGKLTGLCCEQRQLTVNFSTDLIGRVVSGLIGEGIDEDGSNGGSTSRTSVSSSPVTSYATSSFSMAQVTWNALGHLPFVH